MPIQQNRNNLAFDTDNQPIMSLSRTWLLFTEFGVWHFTYYRFKHVDEDFLYCLNGQIKQMITDRTTFRNALNTSQGFTAMTMLGYSWLLSCCSNKDIIKQMAVYKHRCSTFFVSNLFYFLFLAPTEPCYMISSDRLEFGTQSSQPPVNRAKVKFSMVLPASRRSEWMRIDSDDHEMRGMLLSEESEQKPRRKFMPKQSIGHIFQAI